MKWKLTAGALCLALQAGTSLAAPVQVWNNGGIGAPVGGDPGGSQMSEFLQAEDFTLATSQSLSSFTFWAWANRADYAGSITYTIYGNSGGSPDAALSSGSLAVTPTSVAGSFLGLNAFQFDVSLGGLNLAAGTYWLALHNGAANNLDGVDFYWAMSDFGVGDNGGTNTGQELDLTTAGSVWGTNGFEHAFALFAEPTGQALPEPAGLALALSALALMGTVHRGRAASRTRR